jgi:hypothetical protein
MIEDNGFRLSILDLPSSILDRFNVTPLEYRP